MWNLKFFKILFLLLVFFISKVSYSMSCKSVLSQKSNVVEVNFSSTSLRGRVSDHVGSYKFDIFNDISIKENLHKISEAFMNSKNFNSKEYLDLDSVKKNWKASLNRRFTRSHVLNFLKIISPEDKKSFLEHIVTFDPDSNLSSHLKDLQNRFVLYMIHDWILESSVILASEIGLKKIDRFFFAKIANLSGLKYDTPGLRNLEKVFFSFINRLNSKKLLSKSRTNNILEAYSRVIKLKGNRKPSDEWLLYHDVGDLKLGFSHIEFDFKIFFEFIGFTNKNNINYLVKATSSNPSVIFFVYDLIYSTLMFYNAVNATDPDLTLWSRAPVERRLWTPNRTRAAFDSLREYTKKGAGYHSPNLSKAVNEILFRLLFSLKNSEYHHDFNYNRDVTSDEFYFKTFKNIQILAIHHQNKELYEKMSLTPRESAVLSLLANLKPKLSVHLSRLSSDLVDKKFNDDFNFFIESYKDDEAAYIKLSSSFKNLIEHEKPDQDWLQSYYELTEFHF